MKGIETFILSAYPVTGGSGKSFEDAIVFNEGMSEHEYVGMEYEIARDFFMMNPNVDEAQFEMQSLCHKEEKVYDILTYKVSIGKLGAGGIEFEEEKVKIYFDITANFGKHNPCISDKENELCVEDYTEI